MSAHKIKTVPADAIDADEYLKKAEDNAQMMDVAVATGNANAAATLAVQVVISAADAACAVCLSVRSASSDHGDVCSLLASITINGSQEKAQGIKRVIAKKNAIQYESRSVTSSEARDLAKSAERVLSWTRELFEKRKERS